MNTPTLDGVLVVAFEQAVAAPYCTSRLAQDGARVLKVERREGDFARGYDDFVNGEATYFLWLNGGKESVVLDLKAAPDLETATRLVSKADVVVENLAPGALSRCGINLRELRDRRPELITCSISGYGTSGPYASMKAYDLLVQAETGLCAVTGGPESPARVGISLCDIVTGTQAYAAILKALLRRERDGAGASIALSMFECMSEWMAVPLMQTRYSGKAPPRLGVAHPSIAPYGMFSTKDGIDLLIAAQNDREWKILSQILLPEDRVDDERFATNVLRVRNRTDLDAILSGAIANRTAAELEELLRCNKIAFARLRPPADVVDHPALSWIPVQSARGEVQIPKPGAGVPERGTLHVPAIDEHGWRIREEFAPKGSRDGRG